MTATECTDTASERLTMEVEDTAASVLAEHRFTVSRAWTPDTVVGCLRDTDFARPDLFTDRSVACEAKVRWLLDAHSHSGVLRENVTCTVLPVLLSTRHRGTAS
ncbi:hypothetical protein [Streptomyces poonensis]|uniref:Uncharacterized protein n=1 Tax=Streptomyces poonensis TaxID=68255 RepID=A0A918PE98_9ACTN|nr:hypothetical protein [Streptomyces poonensis]GGZ01509.1 hypothetical protein GCM10010365_20650 [Streptomyces poonensis]GLJ90321.1 hypothetical protein GCM10017589_29240 [Streptomyces poonensis]